MYEWLERRLFRTKWAPPLATVLLIITLNSFLLFFAQLLHTQKTGGRSLLDINLIQKRAMAGVGVLSADHIDWTDNLASTSFADSLIPEPIDIVYTWVNGSDPRQMDALLRTKLTLLEGRNMTSTSHNNYNNDNGAESVEIPLFQLWDVLWPCFIDLTLYLGYIDLRPCNDTEKEEDGSCYKDEEKANRFQDNEEMRYSLRSVLKYAPWVRRIYLVTNGQIPNWLNIQHPRIHLVTHASIFPNSSHLPTFSSPAIECHLHRIPGLSNHFLYLNDDTMFGNEIHPSDFYTVGRGQRVFLSWPVPDCSEGCPSNWIGDGYCDMACNTSSCDWDGGDCANSTATTGGANSNNWWWQNGQTTTGTRFDKYCASGCPDSWIGDNYCDRSCRHVECGMDGGDCGVDTVFNSVLGFDPIHPANTTTTTTETETEKTLVIEVPEYDAEEKPILAAYFNLSSLVGADSEIIDASHTGIDLVRAAIITRKAKVLILSFQRNQKRQSIEVAISVKPHGSTQTLVKMFNVTAGLSKIEEVPTASATNVTSNETSAGTTIATNSTSDSASQSGHYQGFSDGAAKVTGHNIKSAARKRVNRLRNLSAHSATQRAAGEADNDEDEEEDTSANAGSGTGRALMSIEDDADGQPKNDEETNDDDDADDDDDDDEDNAEQDNNAHNKKKKSGVSDYQQFQKMMKASQTGYDYREKDIYPWEAAEMRRRALEERAIRRNNPRGRRLLDNYGESLKHVNKLLNEEFGPAARRVPAHMPHYLQKDILNKMQAKWPEQFERTSSHQLRAPDDMQYAFSHMYFMMHERREYNFTKLFHEELDSDKDGVLSTNELRTVAVSVQPTQFAADQVVNFLEIIANCTENSTIPLTFDVLSNCSKAMKKIDKHYSKRLLNKFEIAESDEVAFVMVRTNATDVQHAIDGIRQQRQKFVCLNDNLNHSNPHAEEVVTVVQDFYKALFPNPSPFELPPGKVNKYLYVEDLLQAREQIGAKKRLVYIMLVLVVVVLVLIVRSCSQDDSKRPHVPPTSRNGPDRDKRMLKLFSV